MESLTKKAHRTLRDVPQRASVIFLLAWSLLDICSNLRYPGHETRFSFLLPSLDVAVVLAAIALLAARGVRLPRSARVALVCLFVVTRLMRIGDGFQDRFFHRAFNLYFDLRLVPELVRLFYDTAAFGAFVGGILAVVGVTIAMSMSIYWALAYSERYLQSPAHRKGFAVVLAAVVVASPIVPDTKYYPLRGAFTPSIAERFAQETDFLLHVYGYRRDKLRDIDTVQRQLRSIPHDLAGLGHVNVYLFVVESYGQTVFADPNFSSRMKATYASFQNALKEHHFDSASAFMTSPTYGGRSWLAHATLATGVRTPDQFHYELLLASHPAPIAGFFEDAGYRTVSVLPGTRRKWPEGDIYRFQRKYYLADFDYTGPELGWGKLPDQYVLDFVRRHETERRDRPLFVEYVLVSSHAPWAVVPPVLEDWSAIGRGEVYGSLESRHFGTSFGNLENASGAYLSSVTYDLQVLQAYLCRFVKDDSLVVILGDHQPVPDVTGDNQPWSVPVHVISRQSRFIERFVARGYTRGMIPKTPPPHPGLETFLPRLLSDFSSPSEGGGKS